MYMSVDEQSDSTADYLNKLDVYSLKYTSKSYDVMFCCSAYTDCLTSSRGGIGNLVWIIPVAVIGGLLVLGGIILLIIILLIVCIKVSLCVSLFVVLVSHGHRPSTGLHAMCTMISQLKVA